MAGMLDETPVPGPGPLANEQWWGCLARPWPVDEQAAKNFLLQIIAFTPDGTPTVAGTAFIVAAGPGVALALSATHVLPHAYNIQNPYQAHAPSALPEFLPPKIPSIDHEKLRMIWMGSDHATMLKVSYVSFAHHDIVAYLVEAQDDIEAAKFKPSVLPLDLTLPSVGDHVWLITQLGMDQTELVKQDDGRTGFVQHRSAEMYQGVITEVTPGGVGQHKHACFTVSIPTLPGMSGSPLYVLPKTGGGIGSCGVLSADFSPDHSDGKIEGHSVATCAFLALAIPIPEEMRNGANKVTIYEMMKRGDMPKALGGFENFTVEKVGNDYQIQCPQTHAPLQKND